MPVNPVSILGALPIGDPAAMRAHAARLHADASAMRATGQAMITSAQSMPFEAPAAARLKGQFKQEGTTLVQYAERLDTLAAHMSTAATNVAAAQSTWRAKAAKIIRDATH